MLVIIKEKEMAATKKTVAKKTATKKVAAKPVAKKAAPKKAAAKKTTTKKAATTKAAAKRVTFKLNANNAGSVYVAGEFNGWDSSKKALKKNAKGEWTGIVNLKPGNYQYKYVVDSNWVLDSASHVVDNGMGGHNNLVVVK